MMRLVRILLIICILAEFMFMFAQPASADDNITIGVVFNTQTAGPKGGRIKLSVTIINQTDKNITWVDFAVNTSEPYYEHWTGTDCVPAYCFRTHTLEVDFAAEDLDKDKFLVVAINYDSDANPDDVKTHTFRINSIDEVISISASVDPSHGPYRVGDTVFVTHRFTSNVDLQAEDLVFQCILTNENAARVDDTGPITRTVLGAGESIGIPTNATLKNSDRDFVEASYALAYTYLNVRYAVNDVTLTLPVDEALNPDFKAELSAPFYTADKDVVTELRLNIVNTGNQGFGSFYVEDPSGVHIANGDSLGVGETMDIMIPFLFYEYDEWNVRYIVTGDYGYGEHTEETNTIHIICEAPSMPEPEETTALLPTQEAVPKKTVETNAQSPETQAAFPAVSTNTAAAAETQTNNVLLYIIIAVLGVLILGAVIAVPIILKKQNKSNKRK